MIYKNITEINHYDMRFICTSAIKYNPKIMSNKITNRASNSFMYIISGKYRYNIGRKIFEVGDNSVVYLPKGATYSYLVLSKYTQCLQFEIDFYLEDGELIFCASPEIAISDATPSIRSYFEEIVALKASAPKGRGMRICSDIYGILDGYAVCMEKVNASGALAKILPAIEYINHNFSKKLYVSQIAELCFLSQSQLRRIFKREMNMSPIEYKNKIRLDSAADMLKFGYSSIGEISDALGYESVYEFSNCFKKSMGCSPKAYQSRFKLNT